MGSVGTEEPGSASVVWEYQVYKVQGVSLDDRRAIEELNALGAVGWEAVGLLYYGPGAFVLMKRPR
jgi:hypothetical protein